MSRMGGGLRSKSVTEAVVRLGPYAVCDLLGVRPAELMDLFAGRKQPTVEQEEVLRKSENQISNLNS